MEFRILGPVEVVDGDRTIVIASRLQRALLGLLAVNVGRVVPTSRILDDLWGDDAPAGGGRTVAFHVLRLRDALAPDRPHGEPGPIATESLGYSLRVDPWSVDAVRFEQAVADARPLVAGAPAEAVERLTAALALWRGEALEGIGDLPFVGPAARRLEELRSVATEDRIDGLLALGEASAIVPELRRLVAEEPLRERRRGQLMLALYRSGRQADALDAYRDARGMLADELGIDPGPELQALERSILQQDPALLADRSPGRPTRRNPYKGLRPFRESDALDFFGREALVGRLRDRLAQVARDGRCLLLVGPSGSGKSSVVRAGLLPSLRAERLLAPGGATIPAWSIMDMSPGSHPLGELAAVVEQADGAAGGPGGPSAAELGGDPGRLARHLGARPRDRGRPVLVVDQLEELYADSVDPAERDAFLAAVDRALDDPDARLVLVAAIRADALDRPLQDRILGPRVAAGLEPVVPLDRAELERAILRPAELVGASLEPGLADGILADVMARPGALPLLQYALTELFDRSDGRLLTRAAYDAVGGVAGAVAERAERAYLELDDADRGRIRQVFLRLVVLDAERGARARRVRRATLDAVVGEPSRQDPVLAGFVAARLLTVGRDPERGEPTVEVAHEALLGRWPRLAGWIEEEREALWTQGRLEAAASEWDTAGREPGDLLHGSRLEVVRAWAEGTDLVLDPVQREYLDASLLEARRAADAERARAEHERRLERRARRGLGALAVVLAIAAVAATGLLAVVWRQSEDAREAGAIAAARELAVASEGVDDADPQLALLLAIEAARATADRGWITTEAMDSLHWALQAARVPYPAGDLPTAVRTGPAGARGVVLQSPADLVAAAEGRVGRSLTEAECAVYLHAAACPAPDVAWATPELAVRSAGGIAPADALASPSLAGTRVRIASQLPVELGGLVADFTGASGIGVDLVPAATLEESASADVAILVRPDDVRTLAGQGKLLDLRTFVDDAALREAIGGPVADVGLPTAEAGGPSEGAPRFGAAVAVSIGNLLWYPASSFSAAGYAAPTSWADLEALTRRMIREGRTPWCLGLAGDSGGQDAAGWIEDLLLGRTDRQTFEWWAGAHLVYGSDAIRMSFVDLGGLIRTPGAVRGAVASAILTPHELAGLAMLGPAGPSCWLQHAASTIRSAMPPDLRGKLAAVPVPTVVAGHDPLLRVHAYTVVLLRDRPETRMLVAHLISSAFAMTLAEADDGTGLLPAGAVDAAAFPDPLERSLYQRYRAALPEGIVIDAVDRMPAGLGATALATAVREYLERGGGRDEAAVLDRILAALEAVRAARS